ncbi:MAG TPA: hypothetical protein PL035_02490 [Bacillota bacterium]|mgnify:CR=1 FL=1|nr:hypothetical protein [Bacillota bacterium]HQC35933.1 hypothetical protein [Bacillota bacterium]
MKQLIVLIATIVLGIAIAAMVISMKAPAQQITDEVITGIENVTTGN